MVASSFNLMIVLCEILVVCDPTLVKCDSVANVLLHATSGAENGTLVKIPTGNTLLHILCPAKRRIAGLCSAGAIHEGMEVPRGIQVMV